MTDGNEQRRQLFPCRRCGNHSFSVRETTLENKKADLRAESAIGRRISERLHNFPSRRKIALRSVGLRQLSRNLEIVRSNGMRPVKGCARLFETAEPSISTSNVRPSVFIQWIETSSFLLNGDRFFDVPLAT